MMTNKDRILLKLKTMMLRVVTMDKFNKAAHPRGGDPENRGRFSKSLGSKNKLIDKRKNDTLKKDRHVKRQHATIRLSPKEYTEVVSALNTNLTKEERKKKWLQKAVGNYCYTFKNIGFSQYEFIRKEKIK